MTIAVLVDTKPVDFRKGGDGLVALVREALGEGRERDAAIAESRRLSEQNDLY